LTLPPQPQSPSDRLIVGHLLASGEATPVTRDIFELALFTNRWPGNAYRAMFICPPGKAAHEAERIGIRRGTIPSTAQTWLATHLTNHAIKKTVLGNSLSLMHVHDERFLKETLHQPELEKMPVLADIKHPMLVGPESQKLFKKLLRNPDLHFRVSAMSLYDHLIDDHKLPAARIHYIPLGVDLSVHSAEAIRLEKVHALMKEWHIPEDKKLILAPLPLHPNAGYSWLFESLKKRQREDCYTVIIGQNEGPIGFQHDIEDAIARTQLQGQVLVAENCSHWPEALWLADLVVAPNIAAMGPCKDLLLAAAAGRPVITTAIGANAECTAPEATWLIPPKEKEALGAAITETLGMSDESRYRLSQNAQQFVQDHFPLSPYLEDMMGLYDVMLAPEQYAAQSAAI
jgi:glycosyltransferase involved in cell wall biosynthesis